MKQSKGMGSTRLCSFLLTVITGAVLPGHILALVPVTEESYRQAVLPPFLDGLNSLKSVAETLQTSTDLLQDIPNNVRQHLESSCTSLSEAEQLSLAQVSTLSVNVEERLDMIKSLDDEQKLLEAREQGLKVQLSGLQVQESLARQQLQAAQQAVSNANDALNRAIEAKRAAEEEQKLGIGLLFFPGARRILGGIMLSKANEAIQVAEKAVNEAIQTFYIQKDAVNIYAPHYQSYRRAISATEQSIAANAIEIQAIQRDLSWERSLLQKLMNFLIPLRECTTFLSTLAGKTSAANVLLEFSGTIDALLPVLDDIVVTVRPLIENSSKYQLLTSATLPTIIDKLEEANRRVKEAVASKISVFQDLI